MDGKKEEIDEVIAYSLPGARPKKSRRTGKIGVRRDRMIIINNQSIIIH